MRRITTDVVLDLAGDADRAAGEANRYRGTYARSDVDGTIIVASHQQLIWHGRGSVRRAAAYFLGVIDAIDGRAYLGVPEAHQPVIARLVDSVTLRRAGPKEWPAVRKVLFANCTRELLRSYSEGLDEGNSRARLARKVTP